MIWIFERDGARLRCEITRNDAGGEYRLAVTQPDGTETVEDIEEPTALIDRSVTVMSALASEGWRPPGARSVHT